MRSRANRRCLRRLVRRVHTTLALEQARRKQRVDHRAFAQTGLANNHDIELEAAVHHLLFHLLRHGVESHIPMKGRGHRLGYCHCRLGVRWVDDLPPNFQRPTESHTRWLSSRLPTWSRE